MLIYNTASRSKEVLTPVRPGKIHLYVCGVTVYDYCHIGHARSALVFDVLVRHLRKAGLDVTFVRNFTDVDDKIINRANKEGRDWKEVAETYIRAFHEDMDALGILRADVEPRATEHMQDIMDMVAAIISEGKAYATPSGDVYFRVRSITDYGKLSHRSLDDMQAGARVAPGEEKEDPMDFALWKSAKPGEPYWESPWGQGRPGWHIECSAMSKPYLPLDIHGGGMDLIFPHHENEIAQTEACCHCELAKLWMHNAFVQINSEKMSKSLGNFKTIRDILDTWLPETLRYFLLSKQYRSPVDFTPEGMNDAERALVRVYEAVACAREALGRAKWKKVALPAEIAQEWEHLGTAFGEALEDDLNTPEALGHVFSAIKSVKAAELKPDEAEALRRSFRLITEALGLQLPDPDAQIEVPDDIRAIAEERWAARQEKNWAKADELRAKLAELGWAMKDGKNEYRLTKA